MPGILQLNAIEHYTNLIEDDVEENLRNAWNVKPVVTEHETAISIDGPTSIRPQLPTKYETDLTGGRWVIVENIGAPKNKQLPAFFTSDPLQGIVEVVWDSPRSG